MSNENEQKAFTSEVFSAVSFIENSILFPVNDSGKISANQLTKGFIIILVLVKSLCARLAHNHIISNDEAKTADKMLNDLRDHLKGPVKLAVAKSEEEFIRKSDDDSA